MVLTDSAPSQSQVRSLSVSPCLKHLSLKYVFNNLPSWQRLWWRELLTASFVVVRRWLELVVTEREKPTEENEVSKHNDVHGYTHLCLVRRALKMRPRDLCRLRVVHDLPDRVVVQLQSSSSCAGFLARFKTLSRARRREGQFSLLVKVKEGLVLGDFHVHTNLSSLRSTNFCCESFSR